ncbi:hypothetical protein [Methylomonas koyamae]|uniref:hypothetical protein n=1 Tax=Methylomonas koyamae TaxID=702114 RepID=UPI000BC30395|nr:hypothetical protein [Methylomonas koyamae]ATG89303.1 hypothetical protein MKLM6_1041 [Methylomonas koyamae]
MSARYSIFRRLDGSELLALKSQATAISDASYAIDACSKLLMAFVDDDDSEGVLSSDIKNNYVRAGLIHAVLIAARRLDDVGDYIHEQIANAEQGGRQ